jgi:hypothetical protein
MSKSILLGLLFLFSIQIVYAVELKTTVSVPVEMVSHSSEWSQDYKYDIKHKLSISNQQILVHVIAKNGAGSISTKAGKTFPVSDLGLAKSSAHVKTLGLTMSADIYDAQGSSKPLVSIRFENVPVQGKGVVIGTAPLESLTNIKKDGKLYKKLYKKIDSLYIKNIQLSSQPISNDVLALLKKDKDEKVSIAFFEKGELAYQAGNFERAKAAFMLVGINSSALKAKADGYIESIDAEKIKALELEASKSVLALTTDSVVEEEQPITVDEVIIVSDSDEQIVKSGSADGSSLGVMGSAAVVVLGVGFNSALPIVGGLASVYYFSD